MSVKRRAGTYRCGSGQTGRQVDAITEVRWTSDLADDARCVVDKSGERETTSLWCCRLLWLPPTWEGRIKSKAPFLFTCVWGLSRRRAVARSQHVRDGSYTWLQLRAGWLCNLDLRGHPYIGSSLSLPLPNIIQGITIKLIVTNKFNGVVRQRDRWCET